MKKNEGSTVRIAGLYFEVADSLPVFNEFICHSSQESDGVIIRAANSLLNEASEPVVQHGEINVYLNGDGSWLFVQPHRPDCVQVSLSCDYREIRYYMSVCDDESVYYPALRVLLRTAVECGYFRHSCLSLHSACVEVNGVAVAFTGKSGLGKSTRANEWVHVNGADYISGDRPTLRIGSDGVTAYGVPWDGKEQIFRQVKYPLKAIFDIRRSSSVYIRKLSFKQAKAVLVRQAFIPMWDTQSAVSTIVNVAELAEKVPVYRLFCGPDADSAKETYDILFNRANEILEATEEMKIKEGFTLKNIAGEYIVMPTGSNIAKFDGAVVLNGVSAFLFEQLQNPVSKEDLVTALLNEYEIDAETAGRDVDALLTKFSELGLME